MAPSSTCLVPSGLPLKCILIAPGCPNPTGKQAGAKHSRQGPGYWLTGARGDAAGLRPGGLASVTGPHLWSRDHNTSADIWLDTARGDGGGDEGGRGQGQSSLVN